MREDFFEERDVEGDDGDDEGGEAAGECLFSPDEGGVGDAEHEHAEEGEPGHFAGGEEDAEAAEAAEDKHERARDEEAEAGHEEGGKILSAYFDGGVGGSPEEVDASEGDGYGPAVIGLGVWIFVHGLLWF